MHRLHWLGRSMLIVCAILLSFTPRLTTQAAVTSAQLTVKATIAGAASDVNVGGSKIIGYTLLGMSKTGRVVFTKKITTATTTLNQKSSSIALVSGKIPAGITFHLIDKDGDYFGPVILSWASATRTASTKVSSTLNALTPAQATLNLGAITVKTKSKGQGYAYTATKYALAATSAVSAVTGVPKGIGTYGKAASARTEDRAAATAADFLDGADADLDGIINAFDVSDDGDTIPDYADTSGMLTPPSAGVLCESAASFTLFSNFKATQPDFSGTVNAYAQGTAFEASNTTTATALTKTLSFTIQRIGTVCSSTVIKTEFKGVNVPYAPSSYVELPPRDLEGQWKVGNSDGTADTGKDGGTINLNSVTGLLPYVFTCTSTCEISGQDTFMQRVTTANGKQYEFVTTPTFVFISHPMIVAVGTSADTTASACDPATYSTNTYAGSDTRYGSQSSRVSIAASADQTLCVKIFRPQRLAIEGEAVTPVAYYDIGKLQYYPDIPNAMDGDSGAAPGRCDGAMVSDSASDTIGAPTGTLAGNPTYTIAWKTADIKSCFTAKTATWAAGTFAIDIQAIAPVANSGNAAQKLYLTITP
ncbi:MAG: hypothetical protein ACK5S9_09310 [Roseiflexaceae bacterium]